MLECFHFRNKEAIKKMAGDCTHHGHRKDLLVVARRILLELMTLVFDWNSKCHANLFGFDIPLGWMKYIALELLLGLILPVGVVVLHYEGRRPCLLQRRNNYFPLRDILGSWMDILGWAQHIDPVGYKPAGIHCHILPVGFLRLQVMYIQRVLLV